MIASIPSTTVPARELRKGDALTHVRSVHITPALRIVGTATTPIGTIRVLAHDAGGAQLDIVVDAGALCKVWRP